MFNYPLEEELVFADILHELSARLDTIRLHLRLSHTMSSLIRRGLLPTTSTGRAQLFIISMHIRLRTLEHSTELASGRLLKISVISPPTHDSWFRYNQKHLKKDCTEKGITRS